MRINHLFINSIDVEQSTRFYCDLLGFTLSRKFNDGAGDSQIVHKEVQGRDFDLLIVPTGTTKLSTRIISPSKLNQRVSLKASFKMQKALGLKPRSEVPLDSEAGISTFSMYGRTYQHFYVLDPSWVNVEIMCRTVS